ncbi:hypothetical protein [Gryllotalpicola protaetiae]|uniref:Uncharacterized protein n=1 Tax=Gryllotalpicola protaetiae TaxID=2419771 RepID=A0A387BS78_9MICO|nr:hypothetical protein [Gryllotalpicola protaetiae]AYG03787.1 hypothetical protein D7I44_09725 [Gryllotalpicola protaetiae]
MQQLETSKVELDVIPVGEDGWRVSIQGADRANPFALLGFVTTAGPVFEVCVIGRPGDAIVASTLDDAVEVLRPPADEVEGILAGIRH